MLKKLKVDYGYKSIKMANIDPHVFFPWSFEKRAEFLGAPSIEALTKTLIMVNTCYKEDKADDLFYLKYVVIINQFCRSVNAQKVLQVAKKIQNSAHESEPEQKIGTKGFKFRLATPEEMAKLSGYMFNAVTPFFMADETLTVIMDQHIAELEPQYFWMGGGRRSLKMGCSIDEFR